MNDRKLFKQIINELKALLESSTSPWLNLNEACAYCKCSKSTIYRMYNADLISRYRTLPATEKTKGNWLYLKTELDEVIKKHRTSMSLTLERHVRRYWGK